MRIAIPEYMSLSVKAFKSWAEGGPAVFVETDSNCLLVLGGGEHLIQTI
jgi:hypothetical protein